MLLYIPGKDVIIQQMTETVKQLAGFKGNFTFDTFKKDDAPRKLIDVTRIEDMGGKYSIDLKKHLLKYKKSEYEVQI